MTKLSMQGTPVAATPMSGMLTSLVKHRHLIVQMAKREISGRYRGSLLGMMWSLLLPLLMLSVYTFIFSVVFQARWGAGASGGRLEFAIVLFAGLIAYNFFSECVLKAPTLILNNGMYVKKVVFPLETLVWSAALAALFSTGMSVVVLLLFNLIVQGALPWTVVLYPLVLLPLICMVAGLSWFLSSFGVYVRDVGQFIGVAVSILLFLSPVFYPLDSLPEKIRPFFHLNPLTFIIEASRAVLLFGTLPDPWTYAAYLSASLVIAWLGFVWFQRTRKGFADVI